MTKRQTLSPMMRWMTLAGIWLLATGTWQCGKPSPICSERPDAACVTNQDCPTGRVCWQCECIECPTGRLPCGAGGVCIDVAEDPNHCGGCQVICPQAKPRCVQGSCQATPVLDKEQRIEPGKFSMGSPAGEIGRYDDEIKHEVSLSIPFYMWKTEVTQAEYAEQTKNNPSQFRACGPDCPVEQVTWHEALSFANALSRAQQLPECFACEEVKTVDANINATRLDLICTLKEEYKNERGEPDPTACWGYRLPTEAEWEYAARAGTQEATYNGNLIDPSCGPDRILNPISWYCSNATEPQVVATKTPNTWGLSDMLGNVREWVWDFYGDYPSQAQQDPTGPSEGPGRVVRGGCWACRGLENRAAYRFNHSTLRRESDLGFRVVRRAAVEP